MRPEDLLLLTSLDEPKNLTRLAEETGRHASRLSRVVRSLEALHLVQLERVGREVLVRRGGLAANVLLRLLEEFPRADWGALLTEAHLELLAFFSSPADHPLTGSLPPGGADLRSRAYVPKTLRDAADWTGYSVDHVRRLVDVLARRAIVRKSSDGFYLAPEHATLAEFTRLFHAEWGWGVLRGVARDARPIWQLGRTVVFTTRGPLEGVPHGGVSLAGDLGVPLVVDHHTYLRAPWAPTAADAVLQTYLEGPTRTTNVVGACILYAKHRPPDLLDRGRMYGIPVAARLIQEYVEDPARRKGGPFPPAEEFRQMARPYGVT